MKKWITIAALVCLAAGQAYADVSNEVIVGLEGDSSQQVKQTVGGIEVDISGAYETANSQFVAQYTRFFEPLKDDDTPIDLRQFLQHPSTVFAGLAAIGQTVKDNRVPLFAEEDTLGASMLVVGGEYFFPTDTGLFLSLGGGSGTMKQKVNGFSQPDWDVSEGMYSFGVRQYVAPSVELHLAFNGQSSKLTRAWTEQSTKQNVTLLGVKGVIKNTVGLSFEIGGGSRTDEQTGFVDNEFDVRQVDLSGAVFIGKQLSFQLDLEGEGAEQTGLPWGLAYSESTGRATLSGSYWFNERFGLSVPLYSETKETKTTIGGLETKMTVQSSGLGIYAGFRF